MLCITYVIIIFCRYEYMHVCIPPLSISYPCTPYQEFPPSTHSSTLQLICVHTLPGGGAREVLFKYIFCIMLNINVMIYPRVHSSTLSFISVHTLHFRSVHPLLQVRGRRCPDVDSRTMLCICKCMCRCVYICKYIYM